ncbi:MAG: HlyD family efflux transporter periplasmic adaptor subunit [Pseudomonadota bacterium]
MLIKNTDKTAAEEVSQPRSPQAGRSLLWMITRGIVQAVLMIAILAAGFMGMNRLAATKPEVPTRPPFPTVYTVETLNAASEDFRPAFIAYGEIVAGRSVELRSLVAGEVVAINPFLKPGASIQQGAPLVEIDRFVYEGALREAEANIAETNAKIDESRARIQIEESKLHRSKEQLAFAESDRDRIAALREQGTATAKQVEDRQFVASQRQAVVEQTEINITAETARLAQQKAILQRLQWKRDQAERNLDDTVLSAPFDGVVRVAEVEIGKMVNANDVVVELFQQGNLEVRFTLTDERFGRIQTANDSLLGREVEVIWVVGSSEYKFPAKIVRLGAEIAASRGGVEVYAQIDTTGMPVTPRPGAFVEIIVPDRLFENHYRVPETSIYQGDTVYVVVEGKLTARPVAISAYDGAYALVTGDIKNNDEILVTRIAEIGEGLRVRAPGEARSPPAGRDRTAQTGQE